MPGKTEVEWINLQQELILRLDQEYNRRYPGLSLRWTRIYGSRWAHFLGRASLSSNYPYKLVLNENFGLWIENPEILDPADLDTIVSELKGAFALNEF